jgi:hypothetical protein
MELNEIDQLINKYFEGETSLEEEAQIKAFFNSKRILPEKYQRLKAMFGFYESSKKETSELKIENIIPFQKKKTNSFRILYYAVAASITILFGIWFMHDSGTEKPVYAYINGKPVENQELAYKEAQKALMMVSKNLNQGAKNVGHLSELDKALTSVSGN